MIRRGLTMIELLAALILLGLVVGAATTWIQIAARTTVAATVPIREQAAVEAVMRLIADDLLAADFDPDDEERVMVDGERLAIRTRDGGVATHEFSFDRLDRTLRLSSDGRDSVLIDGVGNASFELDDEARVLTVSITAGHEHVRRFSLP